MCIPYTMVWSLRGIEVQFLPFALENKKELVSVDLQRFLRFTNVTMILTFVLYHTRRNVLTQQMHVPIMKALFLTLQKLLYIDAGL